MIQAIIKYSCLAMAAVLCLETGSVYAADRDIKLTGKYLLVPVTNEPTIRPGKLQVKVDDVLIFACGARIAASEDQIAWWGYVDVGEYVGKTATISPPNASLLVSGDEIKHLVPLYQEKGRPQLRFSQMRGWNNDANGMVYYDAEPSEATKGEGRGEYHLMWQANPLGTRMGNQMWGHAVSRDLVHWKELPLALRGFGKGAEKRHPSMADGACYSGSAFVDHNNTLGKQEGDVKTIVAAFTDTELGESLAYSTDKGRTFTILREHNPVYTHEKIGRDPKVVWYAPTKSWVMVVFAIKEGDPRNRGMQFLVSKDLVNWEETCFVKGFNECPEFFQLAVDGDKNKMKWILMGADANYLVGDFDGREFKSTSKGKMDTIHGCYAGQCFSGAPNGRVIYMGWVRTLNLGKGLPFSQGFTLPLDLTLRSSEKGVRLFANPVKELEALRGKEMVSERNKMLSVAENKWTFSPKEKLVEFNITLKADEQAEDVVFSFDGVPLKYNFKRAGFIPANGKPHGRSGFSHDGTPRTFDLQVYVDEASVEIFAEGGSAYFILARPAERVGEPVNEISISVNGGSATIESLKVHKLKSIWGAAQANEEVGE